ncbi:MAG: pyridoxine 5'-phosphate synthase [Bdellovibrio sp.]
MMTKQKKIRLGVNIDHAATLRQVRGGTTAYPDLLSIARLSVKGGAQQITIHLREDRRHIQEMDVKLLTQNRPAPINLEMAATPEMVKKALKYKPEWVCFVPEKREELTTEGGLDVQKMKSTLGPMVDRLQRIGIEISMFIEPSIEQVEASYEMGAEAVELHTGHWVLLKGARRAKEWARLKAAAEAANDLGLQVHAGHGLDLKTTRAIKKLPFLEEVNIGHSLICYSLEWGLQESVAKMARILESR